jgi:hypothetical protein
MKRRYLSTILAFTLVLAAFATTLSKPQDRTAMCPGGEHIELLSEGSNLRFTLYDESQAIVASGQLTRDDARASQTLSITDQRGSLATLTQEAADADYLRITVSSKSITTDVTFESKALDSLFMSLRDKQDIRSLDPDQQATLSLVGQLRTATRSAIGSKLFTRLAAALSRECAAPEAQSLARALGARLLNPEEQQRPPSCMDVALVFYHACVRNGHSEAECALYALGEFLDCVSWQPEQF